MYKRNAILYTFSYMALGCFTPFVGLYLKSLEFSGTQIGLITASGYAVSIFAVAIWGRIYNSGSEHKTILIELLFLCSICIAASAAKMSVFCCVLIGYGTLYFFQSPITSLIDSFMATGKANKGLGSKRAWGADFLM